MDATYKKHSRQEALTLLSKIYYIEGKELKAIRTLYDLVESEIPFKIINQKNVPIEKINELNATQINWIFMIGEYYALYFLNNTKVKAAAKNALKYLKLSQNFKRKRVRYLTGLIQFANKNYKLSLEQMDEVSQKKDIVLLTRIKARKELELFSQSIEDQKALLKKYPYRKNERLVSEAELKRKKLELQVQIGFDMNSQVSFIPSSLKELRVAQNNIQLGTLAKYNLSLHQTWSQYMQLDLRKSLSLSSEGYQRGNDQYSLSHVRERLKGSNYYANTAEISKSFASYVETNNEKFEIDRFNLSYQWLITKKRSRSKNTYKLPVVFTDFKGGTEVDLTYLKLGLLWDHESVFRVQNSFNPVYSFGLFYLHGLDNVSSGYEFNLGIKNTTKLISHIYSQTEISYRASHFAEKDHSFSHFECSGSLDYLKGRVSFTNKLSLAQLNFNFRESKRGEAISFTSQLAYSL